MKRFRFIILGEVIASNEVSARAVIELALEPSMTNLDPNHLAMVEDPDESDMIKQTRKFYERHTEAI